MPAARNAFETLPLCTGINGTYMAADGAGETSCHRAPDSSPAGCDSTSSGTG